MSWSMAMSNGAVFPAAFLNWTKNRSFVAQGGDLVWTLASKFQTITVNDTGRDWTGTQNIGLIFSEAMSGDATGWSVTINGVAKTLTYVSGSGSQNWVMQIGAVIHRGDVIRMTYDTATGTTVSTSGSVEINGLNGVPLGDQLSKRVRFILCDKTSTPSVPVLVPNEAVKAALHEYNGNAVVDASLDGLWMLRSNKATITTDGNAQFDMEYTGVAAVGGSVFAAVVRSNGQTGIRAETVV